MSRLDRLFTLLSTSTSASARNLAAQQLGEVQKTYPDELHNLLSRLHPLLRSKRWETRIAAAGALTAILKEVPTFPVSVVKEEDFQSGNPTIPEFKIEDVLGKGEAFLNASEGAEYEAPSKASTDEQRKRLNAEMGLDVASKLGLCQDLVQNEDLEENLSAREKNMKKRQKRKQAKEKEESSKKLKLSRDVYSVSDSEKESLSTVMWPLEIFTKFLLRDLKSSNWEERHGGATALREIIFIHGASGGYSKGQTQLAARQSHIEWLHNLAIEIMTVLARDRFGDFVSDQVVAPVRETSAMALGNLMKLMDGAQLRNVLKVLLEMTEQSDWECRHGAFLGLKYLLCAVNLDRDIIVQNIYPRVFKGLKDGVDDVVSEAAAALIPVVKQFVDDIEVEQLSELLWNCLTDLDDLTGSTQSTMKLLSEVLTKKVPTSSSSGTSLKELVPRLFPFLHHSSGGVRKAALQTLVSLTSRPLLASEFLPEICGTLMSHLFQRALFENLEDNLTFIETCWGQICDHCPLASLLTATCPLYGHWFSLISRPHMWPLPNELLIKAKKEEQHFLGGPKAQQANDDLQRNTLATRARCQGARLLGKLAGFIAQPVPGFDYSKEPFTPIQMFSQKILLVNLTKSAFQCTAIGLLIMAWCDHHRDQTNEKAPEDIKEAIWKLLTIGDNMEFDETGIAWQQLQTDASDLLATLKYHKIMILEGRDTIPDKPNSAEIEALISYELEAVCKRNRIKPTRIETLVSRQTDIKSRFSRVKIDMTTLSIMTMSALAGAVVSLGFLPSKLNPVIKPLMESIKKEAVVQLQKVSAQKLVLLLELCIQRKMPNPAEKVARNLIHFAYPFNGNEEVENDVIVSLKHEESPMVETITERGTKEALKTITNLFKEEITNKPPKFFERVVLPFQEDHLWKGLQELELNQFLHAFHIVANHFHPTMHKELLKTFDCLANILCHSNSISRHLSSKCLASLSSFKPNETISAVINHVIPNLESTNVSSRRGAIEAMASIVHRMGLAFVPYIVLFIVPVLGRMSDQDGSVRQYATSMFANLIKLIPLDSQKDEDSTTNGENDLPKELLELKLKQRSFIDELMSLKNVQDIDFPVKINAELRSYQMDGVKWLSFLNRYKLHGILCDDMGLGKTLQTICMLSMNHHERAKKGQPACPTLIICPATLCYHWSSEIKKFVNEDVLMPFVYSGPVAQRHLLRKDLLTRLRTVKTAHLAVITSYEVVRSDFDLFNLCHWNYLVLDEGHAIRNAKTKTTTAIKALKANHRLILSGTPIQNSVIELWSLFDFLMPGFLGSERQFNNKYTKPIIGSRSETGKSVSKESKEAGVLAMEALHRQVLPFILRRMKEDVLKDLPPKITQDYYCELSPVQKLLYEDFAKEQKDKNKSDKTHIFQALQYLRKVCNHPKLVLHEEHKHYGLVQKILVESGSNLNALMHATKLPALKQLLNECGIGTSAIDNPNDNNVGGSGVVGMHRALVFCQLKAMMDIVETDLLKNMPNVSYLRLDGSVPPSDRHEIVTKFNNDVSIDLLLLSTSVGGLGLNLTGADTVIFVEHDWNPMKDLQAMDRAHRIGQKKVVNVYRLITRNTVEEKILGLQKFKLKTANSVITKDNSSLSSMATDQFFDLFSLEETKENDESSGGGGGGDADEKKSSKTGVKALLENLPELWDDSQYTSEYNMEVYSKGQ